MSSNLKKPKHFLLIDKNQQLLLENDKYKLKPQNFLKTMVIKIHQNLRPLTIVLQTHRLKGLHLMKN